MESSWPAPAFRTAKYETLSGEDRRSLSQVRQRGGAQEDEKGRLYYGCEANPDCDFMSWQKPSTQKCPKCGSYMVEKGSKLLCADETCGYRMDPTEKEK